MSGPVTIGGATLWHGDCLEILPTLAENSMDAVVCDPPYGIGFMGKRWDQPGSFVERQPQRENRFDHVGGNHNPVSPQDSVRTRLIEGRKYQTWCEEWLVEVCRVLKPGAHMLCFGSERTFSRLGVAIEEAGFEIRHVLSWLYGSGFNKVGYIREAQEAWPGCGGSLKPAWEPICLARKPLSEKSVAANVLRWGTGALNIDGCRVEGEVPSVPQPAGRIYQATIGRNGEMSSALGGRWPANLCHDGSEEVLAAFDLFGERVSGAKDGGRYARTANVYGNGLKRDGESCFGDAGSAARFFQSCPFSPEELRFHYSAKATAQDRFDSRHPTVKPVALMQWLVRMVTPPGGIVLDPFAGTGTTGQAALNEGFRAVLIEREAEYFADIRRRLGGELFSGAAA